MRFFVFNGDADGLCALQQLHLAEGLAGAHLVTGPKRHTQLLAHVPAREGDEVTVLDISFNSNREDVQRLLADGARVRYFDHHHAGELPAHQSGNVFDHCVSGAGRLEDDARLDR